MNEWINEWVNLWWHWVSALKRKINISYLILSNIFPAGIGVAACYCQPARAGASPWRGVQILSGKHRTYSPLIGPADQDSVNLDPDPGFFTKKSIYRYFLDFCAVLRILIRIRLPVTLIRIRILQLTFYRFGPSNAPKWPSKASTYSLLCWSGSVSYFSLWCGSGSTTLLLWSLKPSKGKHPALEGLRRKIAFSWERKKF